MSEKQETFDDMLFPIEDSRENGPKEDGPKKSIIKPRSNAREIPNAIDCAQCDLGSPCPRHR